QLKVEQGSFGSILLNRLSICQHMLKINAEVQKLTQLFMRRIRFLARPIKAVVQDGFELSARIHVSKIRHMHKVTLSIATDAYNLNPLNWRNCFAPLLMRGVAADGIAFHMLLAVRFNTLLRRIHCGR
ncbi:MAG: hypothetical protein WBW03_23370, partial [Silvibacterium sp.]